MITILRKNNDGSYTAEFIESMVNQLLEPGGPSANQLAKTSGVSQSTLSRWLRDYKRNHGLLESPVRVPEVVKRALGDEELTVLIVPRKDIETGNVTYTRGVVAG